MIYIYNSKNITALEEFNLAIYLFFEHKCKLK